mgnify:CR=1 FL=1
MFMIFVIFLSACLNFVRHSFEYVFLFVLNFPAYQCFLVIREETGPYQVLAGTVHAFAGMVCFFIFPVRVAAVEIIDCLYVVHRPVDVFGGILFGVGYACQVVGDERFYSVSAGAGECQYRAQEEVVEQLSFLAFPLPDRESRWSMSTTIKPDGPVRLSLLR